MTTSLNQPNDFDFPFQPYDIQQKLMNKLYQVLVNKKIGIFESPTGTGKSLSLLCGTLKFLKDYDKKMERDLQSSIKDLNLKILSLLSIADKTDDWINTQYEMNQKKRQFFELETKLKEIHVYNQKIQDIRTKIYEKEKAFVIRQRVVDEKQPELYVGDNEEEDDFLLPDVLSESEDEDDCLEDCDDKSFRPLQVFFCSRTHSQLTQLVGEVKSTNYSRDIRSVSLASRQNYCINPAVRKLRNNSLMNEQCLELKKSKSKSTKKDEDKNTTKAQKLNNKSCPYYKNNLDKLRNLSLTKVMDIEELVRMGEQEKSCPYYSSRAAINDSQLIFVPYQILFNKSTREQCGINLKNSIVIIDEAHNLIDTISQIHTASLTLDHLKTSHKQMLNYKIKYVKKFASKNLLKFNQLLFITKQLLKFLELNGKASKTFELHEILSDTSIYNINLVDVLKFCEHTKFAQKIHGYSKIHAKTEVEQKVNEDVKKKATKDLLMELKENSRKKNPPQTIENVQMIINEPQSNVIRIVIQFVECLLQRYEGGRILVNYDETTKNSSMKFLLLDPSSPFEDIIADSRSIVLAGGTMKPTDELVGQLFKNCKDRVEIHSFGHVVTWSSILPIALSHGCSGKEFLFTHVNKNCEIMLNEASTTIANICKIVPGGVVCFFTSYDNLNRFYSHMNDRKIIKTIKLRKDVYVEPRNASKTEKILDDYSKSINQKNSDKNGAIIFSVIGGKLSEGMNFSDDLGRCVIVVGLPFPNKTNPELVEKMNFINETISPTAGSEYYENLCMKAVNQSIGRAIRHIGDYATVLLLDSRYHRQNIVQKLPEWIRQNLVMANSYGKVHCEIANFFRQHRKS